MEAVPAESPCRASASEVAEQGRMAKGVLRASDSESGLAIDHSER